MKAATLLRLQAAAAVLLVAAGLLLASRANGYDAVVIGQVALLACVGIGLNVLLGLTGQISFGHVGFYALGAYAVAVLTTKAGWSFWLAWPVPPLWRARWAPCWPCPPCACAAPTWRW